MSESIETPVNFAGNGIRLAGMLGRPAQPEPRRRIAILIHGWAGDRVGPHRILVHAAQHLRQEGLATLRFDLRGRGDSDGDGSQTDLDGMIADTIAAARYALEEIRPGGICLIGLCSGANVAIGAATREPWLNELALWSVLPFQPDQRSRQRVARARFFLRHYVRKALRLETWKRVLTGKASLSGAARAVAGDRGPGKGERNLKDSSRNIMAEFARFKGRALFVTGSADPEGMEGRALFLPFCKARDISADFHLIEGANHSYYDLADERDAIAATIRWLKSPRGAQERKGNA